MMSRPFSGAVFTYGIKMLRIFLLIACEHIDTEKFKKYNISKDICLTEYPKYYKGVKL